jgi:hypothetical protein
MAFSDVRLQVILDITFEASPNNLNVDLANMATDAVLDVLTGFPAVDTTEEFLPAVEKKDT